MYCPSGEISIEESTAAVTVNAAVPGVADPELAEIVAAPVVTPVARPVTSTVATFVVSELQLTVLVMSVELPSEKMPFAANACV